MSFKYDKIYCPIDLKYYIDTQNSTNVLSSGSIIKIYNNIFELQKGK